MPEEEIKGLDETPEETSEPEKKSKVPILLIIIAVGIFVIGIGAFSVFMGVFSSTPITDTETMPDSLSEQAAELFTEDDEDISELDKLEQLIFGHGEINAGDIDELLSLSGEQGDPDTSEEDSMETINWLENEKARLAKERKELEALSKSITAKEHHLKQLLSRVNQLESSRISSLAKLYDGMKASQVAPLIIKLTDEQAVQVLLKMKPANAAKILGALNADRAARISANMITLNEEK